MNTRGPPPPPGMGGGRAIEKFGAGAEIGPDWDDGGADEGEAWMVVEMGRGWPDDGLIFSEPLTRKGRFA